MNFFKIAFILFLVALLFLPPHEYLGSESENWIDEDLVNDPPLFTIFINNISLWVLIIVLSVLIIGMINLANNPSHMF